MINKIGTIYPCGLNKGFCIDSWVRHEAPEEGRRTCRPKRLEYNNEDEVNCLNILSDTNYLCFNVSQFVWISISSFLFQCIYLPNPSLTWKDVIQSQFLSVLQLVWTHSCFFLSLRLFALRRWENTDCISVYS